MPSTGRSATSGSTTAADTACARALAQFGYDVKAVRWRAGCPTYEATQKDSASFSTRRVNTEPGIAASRRASQKASARRQRSRTPEQVLISVVATAYLLAAILKTFADALVSHYFTGRTPLRQHPRHLPTPQRTGRDLPMLSACPRPLTTLPGRGDYGQPAGARPLGGQPPTVCSTAADMAASNLSVRKPLRCLADRVAAR
jgi:hypothetical protein